MSNAKKYENINWKKCNVTLFNLQNKILKAYRNGSNSSLFDGEDLEIHHILPRRKSGGHSLKNLKLLHKSCHKQVEYSTNVNLKAA